MSRGGGGAKIIGEGESQVIAQFTDDSSFAASVPRSTAIAAHDIRNKYSCHQMFSLGRFPFKTSIEIIGITKTKDPVFNILSKVLHSRDFALLPKNRLPDLETKCLNKENR